MSGVQWNMPQCVSIKPGITEVPQELLAPATSTVGELFLAVKLVTKSDFGQDYKDRELIEK